MKSPDYEYTGVAATTLEETTMSRAYSIPLMVVGSRVTISPEEVMHALALKHGLPEIAGHYGYDFAEREFIRLPGSTEGPIDSWPSRKLEDILGMLS